MFRNKKVPVVKKREHKQLDNPVLPKSWSKVAVVNQSISSFLADKDAASLAYTARFLYNDTKDALTVRKLAHYGVVEPNEHKVTAILNSNPTLINVVIKKVTDNSGRELIDNTISQLVYGAGDPEMLLAIKPFFETVYGSEEAAIIAMEKQRNEKFAEDKETDEKQDKQIKDNLAALLTTVIAAITAEQFNLGRDANNKLILSPATLAAIETFREEFDNIHPKRIEKGMHFRNNSLLETYDAYAQAAVQWNYNYNKCALFEDGVLSCALFYAPANDAQRFSQGLYYLQENQPNEEFARSLALRISKNNFYLAVRGESRDFSLSGSSVNVYAGRPYRRGDTTASRRGVGITNLMSNKNILLAELMLPIAQHPKSQCCVIC